MKSKLLNESGGLRVFAVIFETGDEVVEGLKAFARQHRITGAQLTAIGALSEVTCGYFDWNSKDYRRIPVREQVEILTLTGNIGVKGEEPALHAHIVVGKSDGSAVGGHLLEGLVRPTLEAIVTETPAYLRRVPDEETGLALIDLARRS